MAVCAAAVSVAVGAGCTGVPEVASAGSAYRMDVPATLVMLPVIDIRPQSERTSPGWQLAAFQSHDGSFDEPVAGMVTRKLADQLARSGFRVKIANSEAELERLDALRLKAHLAHFQVVENLSVVSAVPHPAIGLVTKDKMKVHLSLEVELVRNRDGLVVLHDAFTLQQKKRFPTGVLNTSRMGRGRGFPIRYLQARLDALLSRVAEVAVRRLDRSRTRSALLVGPCRNRT